MPLRNIAIAFLLLAVIPSCTKDVVLAEPVYPNAERPAVQFTTDKPVPASSNVGGNVTFTINGLSEFGNDFTFYINDAVAEVVAVTATSVTVKVPDDAITGNASVKIGDQI